MKSRFNSKGYMYYGGGGILLASLKEETGTGDSPICILFIIMWLTGMLVTLARRNSGCIMRGSGKNMHSI